MSAPPPPLRVLVDLRWMLPGAAGGLEHVAYCFLERMLARGTEQVTLILPAVLVDRFRAALPAGVRLVAHDSFGSDVARIVRRVTGSRAFGLGSRFDCDVAYAMNGRISPELEQLPAVVMISDLQHMALPGNFTTRERDVRSRASRRVARFARRIVAISEYGRRSIVELLGVAPERVVAIHHATDPVFLSGSEARQRPLDAVLERYGLAGRKYLFLPAQLWPHKNHATVIEAVKRLADTIADPPMLVCSGSTATPHGQRLLAQVEASNLSSLVRFIGNCPRDDMPALYAGAEALVFCSLYEGFGMPVVEAMTMGCPVIASNTTSLPEVAGDAALLIDPTSADELQAAIVRLRTEPALRAQLASRGLRRAAEFSWDRHCNEIVEQLYGCVGRAVVPSRSPACSAVDLRGAAERSRGGAWQQGIYPMVRRSLLSYFDGRR